MIIGAKKNLACDDMEAHAKYLVPLVRPLMEIVQYSNNIPIKKR